MKKMKKSLSAILSLTFLAALMPAAVTVKAETVDVKATYECYQEILSLTDEAEKAALLEQLEAAGFVYDDFSEYPTGLVKDNKASCDYNGGVGFSGAWNFSGTLGAYSPKLEAAATYGDVNYPQSMKVLFGNDLSRSFKTPVDTASDSEYYITFLYKEYDRGTSTTEINTKFILGDSSDDLLYAAIASKDSATTNISSYISVDAETNAWAEAVLAGGKYNNNNSLCYAKTGSPNVARVWNVKMHLSTRSKGAEKFEAKIWPMDKTEPAAYDVSVEKELGEQKIPGFMLNTKSFSSITNFMVEKEDVSEYVNMEILPTYACYQQILAIENETIKEAFLGELADAGFVYDDFTDYPLGTVQDNQSTCTYDGGVGFNGGWSFGGTYNQYTPKLVATETLSNVEFGPAMKILENTMSRKLKTPIDPASDSEYTITLQMKEFDRGTLTALVDTRFILGNSADDLLYGAIASKDSGTTNITSYVSADAENNAWGKILGNGTYNKAYGLCYRNTTSVQRAWNVKMHLSTRKNASETFEVKVWPIYDTEPAAYDASVTTELGEEKITDFIFKDSSFSAIAKIMIEKEDASDYAEIEEALSAFNGNYTMGMYNYLNNLPDSGAKTYYMNELAKNFMYEPFDYETGVMQTKKAAGYTYNGGIGFDGEWYAGTGAFRADRPSIIAVGDNKFMSNYVAGIKLRRNFNTPVDTTKDGEYFMSFKYRDTGNANEIIEIDSRIGFGNATNQNIYAGLYYDAEQQGYFVQGALGETKALGTLKRSINEILNYHGKDNECIWNFVVALSIDADGNDTLKVKMWYDGAEEPSGWDVVTTGEVGADSLDFIQISNNGQGVCTDDIVIESWNVREISLIEQDFANFDRYLIDMYQAVIDSMPEGIAKREYGLILDQKIAELDKITASDVEYATAGGTDIVIGSETAMVNAMFKNTYTEEKTVTVILAVYEGGKLSAITSDQVTVPAESSQYVEWGFDGVEVKLPNSIKNNTEIKAFVWDSMKGQCPVLTIPSITIGTGEDAILASLPATNIYVDKNAEIGEEGVFSSISSAKSYVRSLVMNNMLPEDGILVNIKGGVYNEQLGFTAKDSGSENAPVVYRAYNNEEVNIVGGYEISLEDFSVVTDENVLSRMDEAVRGKVMSLNLKEKGIDYSREIPVTGHSTAYYDGYEYNSTPYYTLSFEGEKTQIAKYPNRGYLGVDGVLSEGTTKGDWTDTDAVGFSITEDDERLINWADESDLYLWGFWGYSWSDLRVKVKGIDTENSVITGENPSYYPVGEGDYYVVYNALCELDMPGEWYVDKNAGMLYFYPPREKGSVIFGVNTGNLITVESASDIYFDGVEISATGGNGVEIKNSRNIKIINSEIHDVGSYGITVKGENCSIEKCHIYNTGMGGANISGGNSETLVAGNNIIKNSIIHNYSENKLAYAPGVLISGVGNKASHNVIYDAPHLAIRLMGNDNVIEYNEIFDVLRDVDDSGAIYAYNNKINRGNEITNNYIHDLESSINNTRHGICAIYLDDMFDGVKMTSNVFADISGYGVFINGGRDNTVSDNISVNLERGFVRMSCIGTNPAYGYEVNEAFLSKTGLASGLHKSAAYSKYPNLSGILDDEPLKSKYNVVKNNVLYNTSKDVVFTDVAGVDLTEYNEIEESLIYSEDPGFVNLSAKDYSLSENSKVYEDLPGFVAPEFKLIGIEN